MIVALVPAAGRSGRMGRPKLILPVEGVPLIARVVLALREGGAARVVVVAPPLDEPGAREIVEAAKGQGAEVIVAAAAPVDMRASVELGLARLAEGPDPASLLLTPGDVPGLRPSLVARVLDAATRAPGKIVIPRHHDRRGHPTLIPWPLARSIPGLPAGLGVNALIAAHAGTIVEVEAESRDDLDDLDTLEHYRRWSTG